MAFIATTEGLRNRIEKLIRDNETDVEINRPRELYLPGRPSRVKIRTPDGREFIVTISEVEEDE